MSDAYFRNDSITFLPINKERLDRYSYDDCGEKTLGFVSQEKTINNILEGLDFKNNKFDDFGNPLNVAMNKTHIGVVCVDGFYILTKYNKKLISFKKCKQKSNKVNNELKFLSIGAIGSERFIITDGFSLFLYDNNGNLIYTLKTVTDENITNSDDESVDGRVIVNGRIIFFNEKCYCYKDDDTIVELVLNNPVTINGNRITYTGFVGKKVSYHDNDISFNWFNHNNDGTPYLTTTDGEEVEKKFNFEPLENYGSLNNFKLLNREILKRDDDKKILNKKYYLDWNVIKDSETDEESFYIDPEKGFKKEEYEIEEIFTGDTDRWTYGQTVFVKTKDGSLFACGRNYHGECGVGFLGNLLNFEKIEGYEFDGKVKRVNCNNMTSYLITTDGDLWVTGSNLYGECGIGSPDEYIDTWTKVDIEGIRGNVEEVYSTNGEIDYHCQAIYIKTKDKNLFVTGYNMFGECGTGDNKYLRVFKKIDIFNGIVEQVNCNNCGCFIYTSNKELYYSGRNSEGQSGSGTTANILEWRKIDIGFEIKRIVCNIVTTNIIDIEDNLWVCGRNSYGECGINSSEPKILTFTKVEQFLNNVKDIRFCAYTQYLIDKDNNLWATGYNKEGQCGLGVEGNNVLKWTKVDFFDRNVKYVRNTSQTVYVIDDTNTLWFAGSSDAGQGGILNTSNPYFKKIIDNVEKICTCVSTLYILTKNNKMFVCGVNVHGQCADGSNENVIKIKEVKIENYFKNQMKTINNGKPKTFINSIKNAYLLDRMKNLYVTGSNEYGELGLGLSPETNLKSFNKINLFKNNVEKILCAGSYTIGKGYEKQTISILTSDKEMFYTGNNEFYQFGNGNNDNVYNFTKNDNNINVKSIFSIGMGKTLFIVDDEDNLWTCGYNVEGQCGIGSNESEIRNWTKVNTFNKNVKYIISGGFTSYLVDKSDNLWVTGNNAYGQCGDGTTANVLTWKKISQFDGIVDRIYVIYNTVYLVDKNNDLWVCGNNRAGQCGDGTTTNVLTWKKVDTFVNGIPTISNGTYTIFLVLANSSMYVTGGNDHGQCGDNTSPNNVLVWKNVFSFIQEFTKKILPVDNGFLLIDNKNSLYRTGITWNTDDYDSQLNKWTKIADDVVDIQVSAHTAFARRSNGDIYAIGKNDCGEAGVGSDEPVLKTLTKVPFPSELYVELDSRFIISDEDDIIGIGDSSINSIEKKLLPINGDITDLYNIRNIEPAKIQSLNGILIKSVSEDNNEMVDGKYKIKPTKLFPETPNLHFGDIDNIHDGGWWGGQTCFFKDQFDNLWVTGRNNTGQCGVNNGVDVKKWTFVNNKGLYGNIKSCRSVIAYDNDGVYNPVKFYESDFATLVQTKDDNIFGCGTGRVIGTGKYELVKSIIKIRENRVKNNSYITNNVKKVLMGDNRSGLLTNNNKVYACGDNNNLDVGVSTDIFPDGSIWQDLNINSTKIKQVFTRFDGMAMIDIHDNLWMCGTSSVGETGLGDSSNKKWTKIPTFNKNVKKYVGCTHISFVIDKDDNLWVTGFNIYGQCGDGTTNNVLTWKKISQFDGKAKGAVQGIVTSYVVDKFDNLWVAGFNLTGQCGDGTTTNVLTWKKISKFDGKVSNIYTGTKQAFLIDKDGKLWVTGLNDKGQLGDGTTTNVTTWKNIPQFDGIIKDISVHFETTYILDINGNLWVAGDNTYGQCGLDSEETAIKTWTKVPDMYLDKYFRT